MAAKEDDRTDDRLALARDIFAAAVGDNRDTSYEHMASQAFVAAEAFYAVAEAKSATPKQVEK